MYHPTSRVLAVLELLQSRGTITGPELAERLEMDVRTVRRYISHLQDVGIPVEANIGRHGGYRLRAGFKLPPLMFTEEEATAIMLGLLTSTWLEVGQSPIAIEGAMAKVSRVLPMRAKERLQAMSTHLVLFPHHQQERPSATLLIDVSEAIHVGQRIEIEYRSHKQEYTQRIIEPYSISGWKGRWYLVGFCCLRQDFRSFRLDHIQRLTTLTETFEKDQTFNLEAFIQRQYGSRGIAIEIEFQVPLAVLKQKIQITYATLTETETGVMLREQVEDVERFARYLMAVDMPFVVHNPPELREAMVRLGEKLLRMATPPNT
jgi:predicted DNA-binding transcriptional regulator YafY